MGPSAGTAGHASELSGEAVGTNPRPSRGDWPYETAAREPILNLPEGSSGMNRTRVPRSALIAVALVVAGCSSTGTEGPTSVPGQQAPSKATQAAAEELNRDAASAAQDERRAKLQEAARAELEEAQATRTKLNEAASTRLDAVPTP